MESRGPSKEDMGKTEDAAYTLPCSESTTVTELDHQINDYESKIKVEETTVQSNLIKEDIEDESKIKMEEITMQSDYVKNEEKEDRSQYLTKSIYGKYRIKRDKKLVAVDRKYVRSAINITRNELVDHNYCEGKNSKSARILAATKRLEPKLVSLDEVRKNCKDCNKSTDEADIYMSTIEESCSESSDIEDEDECCENPYGTSHKPKTSIKTNSPKRLVYKCPQCSFKTLYRGASLWHFISKHKTIQCTICKVKFNKIPQLKEHITSQHGSKTAKDYKCLRCPYQTDEVQSLVEHTKVHEKKCVEYYFKCTHCTYTSNTKTEYETHVKNEHNEETMVYYGCTRCPYETNNKDILMVHEHTRNIKVNYKCLRCIYEGNTMWKLTAHIQEIHAMEIIKIRFEGT